MLPLAGARNQCQRGVMQPMDGVRRAPLHRRIDRLASANPSSSHELNLNRNIQLQLCGIRGYGNDNAPEEFCSSWPNANRLTTATLNLDLRRHRLGPVPNKISRMAFSKKSDLFRNSNTMTAFAVNRPPHSVSQGKSRLPIPSWSDPMHPANCFPSRRQRPSSANTWGQNAQTA